MRAVASTSLDSGLRARVLLPQQVGGKHPDVLLHVPNVLLDTFDFLCELLLHAVDISCELLLHAVDISCELLLHAVYISCELLLHAVNVSCELLLHAVDISCELLLHAVDISCGLLLRAVEVVPESLMHALDVAGDRGMRSRVLRAGRLEPDDQPGQRNQHAEAHHGAVERQEPEQIAHRKTIVPRRDRTSSVPSGRLVGVPPADIIRAMTGRELLVLGVAAACSLSVMGWIIWSERPVPPPASHEPAAAPGAAAEAVPEPEVREVDAERAAELEAAALAAPDDAAVRVSLGDLYFDAREFETAIAWYEDAMAVDPAHVDANTSIAMSWFHAGDTQRAVETFERSLEIDPAHPRTLLNLGIVRALGFRDLEGALAAWEQVIAAAPDSREALDARELLDRVGAAHESTPAAGLP